MSRNVLFFDALHTHLPLIRAVAARGFTPVVHSPLEPVLREEGAPFYVLERFVPADVQARVQAESQRLAQGLQRALQSPQVIRAFSSPLGEFLPATGDGFFRQLLGLAANEMVVLETMEALLSQMPLSLIVMGCDNSPTERVVVEFARRRGIPTLQLAHAIYTRPLARIAAEHRLFSDHIAVYGQRAKEIMVEYGIEPERIFPTGAPSWDAFYTPDARMSKLEAREKLGLDAELPTLLYCSAYVDGSSAFFPAFTRRLAQVHRSLIETARGLGPELQLVVRPHPNELARAGLPPEAVEWLDGAYLERLRGEGLTRAQVLRSHKVESILASDAVLAVGSSSIIAEAMILGRPVVIAPWLEQEQLIYTEDDGVAVLRDAEELPGLVESLMREPARRDEMVERQSAALEELNFASDGRATERVAELSERLAAPEATAEKTLKPALSVRKARGEGALKLIFAAHNFLPYGLGGTERYTKDLALEMRRRGHDVRVLYPRYALDDPSQCSVREGSFEELPVTEVLTAKNAFGLVRNEGLKPPLRQYLQQDPPDLVHAQHLMGLGVSFVELLEELQIPLIFTANDFWFMCQQIHLVSPEGLVCSGPETMDKCVECAVSRMGGAPEEHMPRFFHFMAERYYTQRRFMRGLELILCPSKFLMDAFLRYEFAGDNALHAPQGANLFTPLERPTREVPPVVFAYVGTVDYRKGTDLAVEAFNQLESEGAELRIHGNIADKAYFDRIMQAVGPDKTVTYHGEYTAEDLPSILSAVDVALVPSRGENYPFVIREILNARVPVVASDVAGIPEIIRDGRNGLIFSSNDAGDLASKMERLVRQPELIETLRGGIEPVKSIPEDADEIEVHYRRILAGRHGEIEPAAREEETKAEAEAESGDEAAPRVSIVIPVYDQLGLTRKCLDSVRRRTPKEIDYELIVVDNGSSDGTAEFLRGEEAAGRLRAVFNRENLGFAKACNQGARLARGEYVLFLNNDTEARRGWLEPLVEILDSDPQVAAVGSKLLFPDGTIQHAGVVISEQKGIDPLAPAHIFYESPGDHGPANVPRTYQAVTAACALVRRSAFEAVGGFDEGYWNGYEDMDLCFKFQERGWLVVYEPRSVVVHHEGQSGPERNSATPQNIQRLHEKWLGKVQADLIVEPGGEQAETDAGKVRSYALPEKSALEACGEPSASVIIVTYNSASTIRACLDTVLEVSRPDTEVVVVDNASADDTRSILGEYQGRITTILNDENLGFSRGCNQGIEASSGHYVVLLNPDTAVTPGWIEHMEAHFSASGEGVGAVGPLSNCVAAAQSVGRFMPEGKDGDYRIEELAELLARDNRGRFAEAKLLIGFCMMLPRRVLEEVGGLDEKLFLGNDDLELSWRLREAGYRLLIAADAFVYHEGQVSFRSDEESKTSALIQESTDRLYEKLEAHYGEGRVPHPMELWGIEWFTPSKAQFLEPPEEGETPLTSIIILTYNELDHTKLCLASIEAHTPEPYELIMVDNGSTDGTAEFLREYAEGREGVSVVANASNLGFAAGNNQGLALARGEAVLLLNNDTIVTPGWLGRMLAVFSRHERAGIVGPVSNYVSGPQLITEASYKSRAEMESFATRWAEEHSGLSEPTLRVVGFCLLARRAVVEAIGGLDEQFGSGNFEDDDFCIRAARAGFEAHIARDVFIHHTGSQTFKGAKIDYQEAMERNWGLFKAKWGIPLETPMTGRYHLPPEPPKEALRPVALPELEESHTGELDGRWWRELSEEERAPKVRMGFMREPLDGAEAFDALRRFNGSLRPPQVLADGASINRELDGAEYLLLVAPDVVFTKGWLEGLLDVAEAHESIAAVGPTSNEAPDPQKVKAGYQGLKKSLQKFATRRARQHKGAWEEVPYLGGFCLLLKSGAVLEAGGVDEGLPLSDGLWDLFGRLQAGGYKLACALGAYVHHEELSGDEGARYDETASLEAETGDVLGEAHLALERGDLESAAGLFEEAARSAPHVASIHWAFGSTLVALERMDEGIEALRRAAEIAPGESALQNQIGVALYQMGQPEEARQAFEAALAASPDDVDTLLNLVELHRAKERYAEATEHLKRAQSLAPVDVGVLSALGSISVELGDVETARKALEHLEAVEPQHPEIQPLREAIGVG